MYPNQRPSLALPIAIVLASGILAAVIFITRPETASEGADNARATNIVNDVPSTEVTTPIRPIQDFDLVRGNPDASIMFVTYTDFTCPRCSDFHDTMSRLLLEYGPSGQVAWTVRPLPLPERRPGGYTATLAAECAASLGGTQAFWAFTDTIADTTGEDETISTATIEAASTAAGLERSEVLDCVDAETHGEYVTMTAAEAIDAGATHVPYTVILVGDNQGALNGAQPYTAMQTVTEDLLLQFEEQILSSQ